MKLFIDTVNEDLFVSLIQKGKTIEYIHLKEHKQKSDTLPIVFQKLIKEADIKAKDIKDIYVVNGPGSFMGIRAGIVFAKTMALTTKANLYSLNNISFISGGLNGIYYVDAKGGKSYTGIIHENKFKIEIGSFKPNSKINYDELIGTPMLFLDLFKKIDNILEFKEEYFKEPQVGKE